MATTVNALKIRRMLGPKKWLPPQPWGPDGWCFGNTDFTMSIIVSCAWMDGVEWIHASIAYTEHGMPIFEASTGSTVPTHDDMQMLHAAIFGEGYAYQVFPVMEEGVLHLFGRSDGKPVLPEFGGQGAL
jgi:hypothetical protein